MEMVKNKRVFFIGFKEPNLVNYINKSKGFVETKYSDAVTLVVIKSGMIRETKAYLEAKQNNKTIISREFFLKHYVKQYKDYGKHLLFLDKIAVNYRGFQLKLIYHEILKKFNIKSAKSLIYSPKLDRFYLSYSDKIISFRFIKEIKSIKLIDKIDEKLSYYNIK